MAFPKPNDVPNLPCYGAAPFKGSRMDSKLILVTGASGFVGKWTVIKLLQRGYRVRGTIRSEAKGDQVMKATALNAGEAMRNLHLVQADILDDTGWEDAMDGVDAVMHVATAIREDEPRDSSLVIRPAIEGTERVLRFTHRAGIERFILTSSIATVGYGHGQTTGRRVYNETHFTNLESMRWTWAYGVGKTRAERAAWEFVKAHGMDMTTIHPGAIIGPALDDDASISIGMVTMLFDAKTPALPSNGFSIIDVRDVADMHVAALEKPEASNQRYLATAEYMPFPKIAATLRELYPGRKITSNNVPDWIIRLLARFGGPTRQIINDIGNEKIFDGSKGERLLGRGYISARQSIADTAEAAIKLGLVKAS
jgi:dihydroflavonol-4-reductase